MTSLGDVYKVDAFYPAPQQSQPQSTPVIASQQPTCGIQPLLTPQLRHYMTQVIIVAFFMRMVNDVVELLLD